MYSEVEAGRGTLRNYNYSSTMVRLNNFVVQCDFYRVYIAILLLFGGWSISGRDSANKQTNIFFSYTL